MSLDCSGAAQYATDEFHTSMDYDYAHNDDEELFPRGSKDSLRSVPGEVSKFTGKFFLKLIT